MAETAEKAEKVGVRGPVADAATSDERGGGSAAAPVLIDFGKRKRKQVKRLRQGRGPLLEEVEELLAELRAGGSIAPEAQPVIVVVQSKRRRGKGWF